MEFKCKTCHKACQNTFDFIRHFKRNVNRPNVETVIQFLKVEEHFKHTPRNECFRTFCNEDHFQRHLRTYEKRKQTANLKQQISQDPVTRSIPVTRNY